MSACYFGCDPGCVHAERGTDPLAREREERRARATQLPDGAGRTLIGYAAEQIPRGSAVSIAGNHLYLFRFGAF